jgi:hypothetical protein
LRPLTGKSLPSRSCAAAGVEANHIRYRLTSRLLVKHAGITPPGVRRAKV